MHERQLASSSSNRSADEDEEDASTRGAHLKLAQRHRRLVAGRFRGARTLAPEEAAPGVCGHLALCFTTCGALPSESRITCRLPDVGWRPITASTATPANSGAPLNALLRAPQGCAAPRLRALWFAATRTLEFTLAPGEGGVDADTPVAIVVSGVCTPESATPQAECVVTAFEKLVQRQTTPPSTRGGQIIDGPCTFSIPRLVPGQLTGPMRWLPFSCCPGASSDVALSFSVNGAVPPGGRVLVELPADGWEMPEHPTVLLRNAQHRNSVVLARWTRAQHALEVTVPAGIPMKSSATLTIARVQNPSKETLISASRSAASSNARITTLSASGGVVDGPSKLEVAPISALRDADFAAARASFDAEDAEQVGHVLVEKIPHVLERAGVHLSDELYQSLVVANLPAHTQPREDALSSPAEALGPDCITRDALLNIFASVYAPAYKFGQELRLACGRGQVESVREWLSRGCDPNAKDGSGWTALHYAADFGQLGVVHALLDATGLSQDRAVASTLELNARDGCGWTPLMCAAANGHMLVAEALISVGADLLLASAEGRTALHWAAARGMSDTVQMLLDKCGDVAVFVGTPDRSGWSPLHCALLHDAQACAALLIARGASASLLDKLQYPPTRYGALADSAAPTATL
ncbi:hypothetical protein PybrP1_006949 [[Pythium] brassicae (nom. inval.)]|nr:hypothetical protein PybrP1_006949 [[Pythium] brassicae (nom. inval.)]